MNIFKALGDTVKVLKVIHAAGWVHRDISVNNLYWSQDGFGLLSDLEYAKRKSDAVAHDDVRTGTIQFIASEVARCTYLFYFEDPEPGEEELIFSHNDLHDLESLYWILVWILLHREDLANPLDSNLRQSREYQMSQFFAPAFTNRTEFLSLRNNRLVISPSLTQQRTLPELLGELSFKHIGMQSENFQVPSR
ncbi:hypothetical protein VKT23_020454 [Stygiomarasmius scandens]|uniref:Protein kinase domain-containing protein n=1 Tax=Marasmiellus scandens TaxID=2682957 RepID=A0ABR1IJ31_9AGAR